MTSRRQRSGHLTSRPLNCHSATHLRPPLVHDAAQRQGTRSRLLLHRDAALGTRGRGSSSPPSAPRPGRQSPKHLNSSCGRRLWQPHVAHVVFNTAPGLAVQRPRRSPRRFGRGAGPHSRGHRLLDHRRCRSQGRPVRFVQHRGHHRLHRGPARHDLGGHRRDGAGDGAAGQGAWPAVPAGGHRADRRVADRGRAAAPGFTDALRLALGDHRLR